MGHLDIMNWDKCTQDREVYQDFVIVTKSHDELQRERKRRLILSRPGYIKRNEKEAVSTMGDTNVEREV